MDEDQIRVLEEFVERARQSGEKFSYTNKQLEKTILTFDTLNKGIKAGTKTISDQIDAVQRLDQQLTATATNQKQRDVQEQLQSQRNVLANEATNRVILQAATGTAKELGKAAYEFTTKGVGQIVQNLQGNTGPLQIASDILGGAISAGGKAISSLGQTTSVAGTALGILGKVTPLTAIATVGLGKIFEALGEQGAKLLGFGLKILTEETNKTIKAFQSTSAAGALFVDGMTGMRNAAGQSELTLAQFSKVISTSSRDIAFAGLGLSEGARRVGDVGAIFASEGGKVRQQLLKLGFGFEEQAEITAETIANITRTGIPLGTTQQIATETQKYAENLRLISAITGEDARAKQKQVREQNMILAFQNEIANMGPGVATQINLAMANMTKAEQIALRDRVILGGQVVTQEAAIYESTLSGARQLGELYYELYNSGKLSAKTAAEAQAMFSNQLVLGAGELQDVAIAGQYAQSQIVSGLTENILEARQRSIRTTEDAVRNARTGIEGQKTASDELTTNVTSAATEAQRLATAFEKLATGGLGSFAKVVDRVIKLVGGAVDVAVNGTMMDRLSKAASDIGQGGFASPGANEVSSMFQFGTGVPDSRTMFKNLDTPGSAKGGVLTGPTSGYAEVLHGTEAVVPLPDSRSIPVSIDTDGISRSITSALAPKFDEMIDQLRQNNRLTGGLLNNSY